MRVVVIGGGVSGLAAARVLAGLGSVSDDDGESRDSRDAPALSPASSLDVTVIEASEHLGGKIETGELAGIPAELGPDQFLRRDPSAETLCRRLGLGDRLVAPAVRGASVFSYGRMRRLPGGLVLGVPVRLEAVRESGIVSADGYVRAGLDEARADRPFTALELGLGLDSTERGAVEGVESLAGPAGLEARGVGRPWRPGQERSAGEVLRARLGDEVVDRLIDPLLGGINGGGVDGLSLGSIAPRVAAALVGRNRVMASLREAFGTAAASETLASPFFGLEGGLSSLIAAVRHELDSAGVEVLTGTTVRAVRKLTGTAERGGGDAARLGVGSGGFDIELESSSLSSRDALAAGHGAGLVNPPSPLRLRADAVVVAVPAEQASLVLAPVAARTAAILGGVRYASVAVATLAYEKDSITIEPGASGVLVPRVENRLMTAATWLSRKWPWMSSPDIELVRVSAGRFADDRVDRLDDDDLLGALLGDLAAVAGIAAPPVKAAIRRWPKSFPQYEPGHRARMERAVSLLREVGGIELAGAVLGGIGLPACIASGESAARAVMSSLPDTDPR